MKILKLTSKFQKNKHLLSKNLNQQVNNIILRKNTDLNGIETLLAKNCYTHVVYIDCIFSNNNYILVFIENMLRKKYGSGI